MGKKPRRIAPGDVENIGTRENPIYRDKVTGEIIDYLFAFA